MTSTLSESKSKIGPATCITKMMRGYSVGGALYDAIVIELPMHKNDPEHLDVTFQTSSPERNHILPQADVLEGCKQARPVGYLIVNPRQLMVFYAYDAQEEELEKLASARIAAETKVNERIRTLCENYRYDPTSRLTHARR